MNTFNVASAGKSHRPSVTDADPLAAVGRTPLGADGLAAAPVTRSAPHGSFGSPPLKRNGRVARCEAGRPGALATKAGRTCRLGAALLLAGCASLGGDREETIPSLSPLEPLVSVRTLWSTSAGSGGGSDWLVLTPAIEGGRVYSADARGRISAYDAESGRSVWRTDTRADVTGAVGAGEGLVAAGTNEGEVIALTAESGEIAWRAEVSSEVLSSPRIVGERVIVRTLDGKLFGLDAGSGGRRWIHDGGAPSLSVRGTGPATVVAGMVVAGFDNGRLAAIRAGTGEVMWGARVSSARGRSELERLADIDTAPVIREGVVYAASHDQEIAAFEAATGREVWRRDIASHSGLAVDQDLLYVADADGSIQALDRLSGGTVWGEDSLVGREPVWPAVHGPFVVFADREGYLHWLRREDGKPATRIRFGGGRPAGRPILDGDTLIALGAAGRLTAFVLE